MQKCEGILEGVLAGFVTWKTNYKTVGLKNIMIPHIGMDIIVAHNIVAGLYKLELYIRSEVSVSSGV